MNKGVLKKLEDISEHATGMYVEIYEDGKLDSQDLETLQELVDALLYKKRIIDWIALKKREINNDCI